MFYIWDRPYGLPFWKIDFEKGSSVDGFEGDEKWEVEPGFVGEQSPVKVDEQMATTIPANTAFRIPEPRLRPGGAGTAPGAQEPS